MADNVKLTLEDILTSGKLARDEDKRPAALKQLRELIQQIDANPNSNVKHVGGFINQRIQSIDKTLSTQMDEILHDKTLQKLEGSWRGLHYLVMHTHTSSSLKVRLMNVSKRELLEDLEKAVEFDQSQLFKKVYEEEYGTFGGHPYSCLLGDYEFGSHPLDMVLIQKIAQVASAAHTPFIAAAAPTLFNLETFSDLGVPRDMARLFESTELLKWRSFRESEDSRYVALTLPHILTRLPYGPNTNPVEDLNYTETVDGTDNSKFCWGNAAYALGERITNAAFLYNWTTAIRGVEGGGLVEDLPTYTFKTTDGDVALKCPTEVAITDRREKELSDLGFISLCHCKGTDYAAFFGGQTAQKPKKYSTDEANANAQLSARLTYILAASRFAHYIKAIMRDKIGSFMSKGDVSDYLNKWIAGYVLLTDEATQSTKARFPLREARIDVTDVPGKPGSYRATVFLRPHFQLEELTASIRLVANLPAPAA